MADFSKWNRDNLERVAGEMLARLVRKPTDEAELLRLLLARANLKQQQESDAFYNAVERATLESEPDIGSGDCSKCLPGWIETFCAKFQAGGGYMMSHAAVSALAHTLIAAKIRCERLVRERDEAKMGKSA
jgi:hypothetical protein